MQITAFKAILAQIIFVRMESDCTLRFGFRGLIKSLRTLCSQICFCLVYKMLFIRALKPNLNVQSDSNRARVFL